MSGWFHEWRLLARAPVSAIALGLLLLLTSIAVATGSLEIAQQRRTIARLSALQAQELAALAATPRTARSAGAAAYYTFHATADPPGPAAFLALGLRDAAPYVLRVRALALQSQLHEGETFNPALALAGRFDVAFVLIYLAPLALIALLHDLVSAERQAGRLRMLLALPDAGHRLWRRRAGLRYLLAVACMAVPILGGAIVHGLPPGDVAVVMAVVAAYLGFWTGLALAVATRGRGGASQAAALMGLWVVLTLVLPAGAHAVLARAVPVHQGVDLMLAQRQAVHAAWDEPPADTMRRFLESHPQWRHAAALPEHFHWKWYYAFQQLGDERVADQVATYRAGLRARQRWTQRLGWLLPGVGAQAALHRVAHTDLDAQLAYQDAIAAFHGRLRAFYYPYLFDERPFGERDFLAQPRFDAAARRAGVPALQLLCLALGAAGAWAIGIRGSRRVRMHG